jgi:16S rRNA (cytosine1402-N4)-methyltransferase
MEEVRRHVPVLLAEVVQGLGCSPHGLYIDCTIGEGGHAEAILRASAPDGKVIGIDQDESTVQFARERLKPFGERVQLVRAPFFDLQDIAANRGVRHVDGILFDLGISSRLLDDPERGFSFQNDGPLDMRMDRRRERRASDLVNQLSSDALEEILRTWGEERWSRRIAQAILRERAKQPITRTLQLAGIVVAAIPARYRSRDRHPATRTFQALRIAVNEELRYLSDSLRVAVSLLKPGGRIGVISFHSLEDRIVKETYRDLARGCICPRDIPVCACHRSAQVQLVTRKPIRPSEREVDENPRSRSARLRVAEKMGHSQIA